MSIFGFIKIKMSFKSNKTTKSNISPLSQHKIEQIKRNMNRFEPVESYAHQLPYNFYSYKVFSQWHHRQFNILSQQLKSSSQTNSTSSNTCNVTLFCGIIKTFD